MNPVVTTGFIVTPAKAGVQRLPWPEQEAAAAAFPPWIPAFERVKESGSRVRMRKMPVVVPWACSPRT